MSSQPVQISLDEKLLRQIDADPETKEKGRSAFIRAAVRLYLKAKERMSVDEAIASAFSGKADAMLREVENLISEQVWPTDK